MYIPHRRSKPNDIKNMKVVPSGAYVPFTATDVNLANFMTTFSAFYGEIIKNTHNGKIMPFPPMDQELMTKSSM